MLLLNIEVGWRTVALKAGRSIKTLLESASLDMFVSCNTGVAIKRTWIWDSKE